MKRKKQKLIRPGNKRIIYGTKSGAKQRERGKGVSMSGERVVLHHLYVEAEGLHPVAAARKGQEGGRGQKEDRSMASQK